MKIGILGAESKHVEFFTKPINKEMLFEHAKIETIWGGDTTKERLFACAKEMEIADIKSTSSEVIDTSDAVIITLRDGNQHMNYALECIDKKKPVFIDKPFTCKTEDAITILTRAKQSGVAITGGSTLCFLPEISALKKEAEQASHVELSYRADPFSPYGGWHFYGSHLTDLCAAICGTDALYVEAERAASEVSANVVYPNKKVRIYSAPDLAKPKITINKTYYLDDENCYYHGMKNFIEMITTRQSTATDRFLFSVRLLEAIMSSLSTGKAADILL